MSHHSTSVQFTKLVLYFLFQPREEPRGGGQKGQRDGAGQGGGDGALHQAAGPSQGKQEVGNRFSISGCRPRNTNNNFYLFNFSSVMQKNSLELFFCSVKKNFQIIHNMDELLQANGDI